MTRAAAAHAHDRAITTGGPRPGRRRRCSRGPFASVLARSGLDANDRVAVGRVLVGVRDPHEERVVEETPDELHADGETGRRLAHGQGERQVAGVVGGNSGTCHFQPQEDQSRKVDLLGRQTWDTSCLQK
jgi:hypothetical protein